MRKTSKKAALAVAAMMVGTMFCTPVFAADEWNNTAIGIVGQNSGYGNVVSSTDAQQTIGALVIGNINTTGNNVVGNVGIFAGGHQNSIGAGSIGGWADYSVNGTVNGSVGLFSGNNTLNSIEQGIGAKIAGGVGNTANGTVGSFTGSAGNKMENVWVSTPENGGGYSAPSIGAYVGNGTGNTANGMVGQFTNAGDTYYWDGTKNVGTGATGWQWQGTAPGQWSYNTVAYNSNIVYASTGAAVMNGEYNTATGTVGQFTGTLAAGGGTYLNVVHESTGARIDNGTSNTAIGTVGVFAPGSSDNRVLAGSMGAYIASGTGNTAVGLVGSFHSGQATVQGTGAMVMGGYNNYANGQVGIMNGFGNVKGIGAVIKIQ